MSEMSKSISKCFLLKFLPSMRSIEEQFHQAKPYSIGDMDMSKICDWTDRETDGQMSASMVY